MCAARSIGYFISSGSFVWGKIYRSSPYFGSLLFVLVSSLCHLFHSTICSFVCSKISRLSPSFGSFVCDNICRSSPSFSSLFSMCVLFSLLSPSFSCMFLYMQLIISFLQQFAPLCATKTLSRFLPLTIYSFVCGRGSRSSRSFGNMFFFVCSRVFSVVSFLLLSAPLWVKIFW